MIPSFTEKQVRNCRPQEPAAGREEEDRVIRRKPNQSKFQTFVFVLLDAGC